MAGRIPKNYDVRENEPTIALTSMKWARQVRPWLQSPRWTRLIPKKVECYWVMVSRAKLSM